MGNLSSCPAGFESGVFLSCHAQCPAEFKYAQEAGTPPTERCVHVARNNRFVTLQSVPAPRQGEPLPAAYATETDRVATEIAKVKGLIKADEAEEKALGMLRDQKFGNEREYSRIQSEYANFNQYTENAKAVKNVSDSLKPMRPPTAPSSELETERRKIIDAQEPYFLFIQVALALIVTALVGYMILPAQYAHGIAFLLLSMAISFGFFLRR